MKRVFWVSVFVLLAVVLASCGDDDTNSTDNVSEKPVIKLAQMPWMSAEVNIQVAKIILEEELGYTVELVPTSTDEQWEKLAAGDVHVQMEVWPLSQTEEIQKYIVDEKTVEDGGELGPVGHGGWYVPHYVMRSHPELRSWESLLDPEIVALFATEETNGKGRLISGDAGWTHSQYAESIVRNLGLDFEVFYAGSEVDELELIKTLYDNEEPLLLYFWTPHWMFAVYDLIEVELPAYTEECYAELEAVACAYPAEHLQKLLWPGLQEYAPEAYTFLKNFNYSTIDQVQVMARVELGEDSMEDSAREWIEANEAIWRAWLPS